MVRVVRFNRFLRGFKFFLNVTDVSASEELDEEAGVMIIFVRLA